MVHFQCPGADLKALEAEWPDRHVQEAALTGFCLPGEGEGAFPELFAALAQNLDASHSLAVRLGLDEFTLDLEPHLSSGGPFGGFSGPDLTLDAFRATTKLLDDAGIQWRTKA